MFKADRICHSSVCTKDYHHFSICRDIAKIVRHSAITPSIRHTGDCCAMSNSSYVVYVVRSPKGCKFPKIISLLVVEFR